MLSKEERDSLSDEEFEQLRQDCRDTREQIEQLFDDLLAKDPMGGEYAVELAGGLIQKICKLENQDAHCDLIMRFEHLISSVCIVAREQGLFEQHVGAVIREIEMSKSISR